MTYSLFPVLALSFAFAASASTGQPSDAELDDWMAYLKSVSLPVSTEVCTPLLADKAAYPEIAQQWLQAHAGQIERGRAFAVAGAPKGRDVDQYHADMVADFRQKLLAKTDEAKLKICNDSLQALQTKP